MAESACLVNKRSKLFCYYHLLSLQLVLCHVAAVKSLPALIYSADYILPLVLRDQRMYSENSKLVICLDTFLNKFIFFG